MLKTQKDSNIVVTVGAEKISWVKPTVFVVSLIAVILYTWLSGRFRQDWLLYGFLGFFVVLFAFFSFVLLPNLAAFTPDTTALMKRCEGSVFWKNWAVLLKNWWKLGFYCSAELFGQFGIIVFFWSVANELFTHREAKRIYPLFISAGCCGGILGALSITKLVQYVQHRLSQQGVVDAELAAKVSVKVSTYLGMIVVGVLILICLLYRWIYKHCVLTNIKGRSTLKNAKISFWQGIKYIASNPYLLAVTVMIVSGAWSTSLVDITYKKYVNDYTGGVSSAYTDWFKHQHIILNMVSLFASLFVAQWVLCKLNWKIAASIAPCLIMVCSGFFFVMSICKHSVLEDFTERHMGKSALSVITSFGRIQAILATMVKYVFFDGTKEIVFIKMGREARNQGKAAVDVVGSRLGKALASTTHIVLISLAGVEDVRKITPLLLFFFVSICIAWYCSVHYLAKKIDVKKDKRQCGN